MKNRPLQKTVFEWMDTNYTRNNQTLRSIWYQIKPSIQHLQYPNESASDFADKVIEKISLYLWRAFLSGDYTIYGNISNSAKVSLGSMPVLFFIEKNTLDCFAGLPSHINSFEYKSAGQSNNYELANIALELSKISTYDELYIFVVTDFDKAGEQIYKSLVDKLNQLAPIHGKEIIPHHFTTALKNVEHYLQKDGTIGYELDAIPNLQQKVLDDIENFLPYPLFELLAIDKATNKTIDELIDNDTTIKELKSQISEKELEIINNVLDNYEFIYNRKAPLNRLIDRVTVVKP